VYTLLGMSSDNTNEASLSPDYKVPWKDLFERLTRFLLCEQISVEASPEKEIAVIKSKGYIVGKVFPVQNNMTRNGRQGVEVVLKNIPGKSGYTGERSSHWTLQISAEPIRIGDIICFLQGASKPTIIRFCEDHWAIILIAATPQSLQTRSECVKWSKMLELVKFIPTRNLQLVWDWKHSAGKLQGLEECTELEGLDKVITSWNLVLVLGDADMYEKAEEKSREAIEGYQTAFRKERLDDKEAHQLSLRNVAGLDLMNRQYGRPPLSWAAEKGYEAVVKLLLGTGEAGVNLKDVDGWTPLSWAAKGDHIAVVERLLEEKAEVNAAAAYKERRTALQAAAGGGHLTVVERLLEKKAEVNAAAAFEAGGRTTLQAAAEGGHLAVVERLLEKKAEVNAAAEYVAGRTALQAAAEGGHLAVVERLEKAGAKI
jgi:hypothetical protein